MARSITTACTQAFCSGKPFLLSRGIVVRKNSNAASVKTVLKQTRVFAGAKSHPFAPSCRNQSTCSSSFILESPLGPVDVPDQTLPQYIWKDFEDWADKPAVVSKHCSRNQLLSVISFPASPRLRHCKHLTTIVTATMSVPLPR